MKQESEKIEFWRRHALAFRESGVTLAVYCNRADLKLHTFQYWRGKFRKEEGLTRASAKTPRSTFVRVLPKSEKKLKETDGGISTEVVVARLRFGAGATLECLRWPEPSWLARVNQELGS